ncbi:hypothetical protein CAP36_07025 [Chitinophagaceae bacterium IBVUCB2]|nr:hypothetical protein CAP36_07025 [Chitinophagaceae bacterium IBVUCB2]
MQVFLVKSNYTCIKGIFFGNSGHVEKLFSNLKTLCGIEFSRFTPRITSNVNSLKQLNAVYVFKCCDDKK